MTPQISIVPTPRGPVEVAQKGEGPGILFLHGAMGGYDQGLLLARGAVGDTAFRHIAVSRPGYLGTPLRVGRSPEDQADACAAVLDALSVPSAAVVAISGGGQCALQFALRHPERCRALAMISACSAPIAGSVPFRFQLIRLAGRFPFLAQLMGRKVAKSPAEIAARIIPDPGTRERTLQNPEACALMYAQQASAVERLAERLPGTENDIAQSRSRFNYPVEGLRAPLLVVHGTDDEAVPFAQAESLAARVPGANLVTVAGGRHVTLFTHLDLVRSSVLTFLRRHVQPGSDH